MVLVERGDYCPGASGASSHMIHGGIRYLENGEFRLVRESVSRAQRAAEDRAALREAAADDHPDLQHLLRHPGRAAAVPDPQEQGKPKERGAFLIKTG